MLSEFCSDYAAKLAGKLVHMGVLCKKAAILKVGRCGSFLPEPWVHRD